MPELPEVETIRQGVEPYLEGRVISDITVTRYDLRGSIPQDIRQTMQGQTVKDLARHGKYILMNLSNDQTVIWHMGMSGSVRIYQKNNGEIEKKKHDHIKIVTDRGDTVIYNDPRRFGMFYTQSTTDVKVTSPFSHMGPDALDIMEDEFFDAIQKKRSPIKTALLDQAVVAGLGNIYVCEALFDVKISPERLACDVTKKEASELVRSFKAILLRSIEKGGSSLKDHRMTDGSMGYFQNLFHVYGRKGLSCPRCSCDTENNGCIVQIKQSGRSTFYCPNTQI